MIPAAVNHLVVLATPSDAPRWVGAAESRHAAALVACAPGSSREVARALAEPGARALVALPGGVLERELRSLVRPETHALFEPMESGLGFEPDTSERHDWCFEWCDTGGARRARLLRRDSPLRAARFVVSGCPARGTDDPLLALLHALALVEFTAGPFAIEAARFGSSDGELEFRANASGAALSLTVRAGPPALDARFAGAAWRFDWRCSTEDETYEERRPDGVTRRAEKLPKPELRALARLLAESPTRLFTASELHAVARARDRALASLPRRLAPCAPRFARATENAGDQLARYGLAGVLPRSHDVLVHEAPSPSLPAEVLAFRAGLKPVVFLTVVPDAVDATLAQFPGAHVERRERRVEVRAQDHWVDDRAHGEVRVELYISHEPSLAREASRLQAEADPSASVFRLGELMGYPACCVAAFARQRDRANNTRNRYETACRTRSPRFSPELNNLELMLLPFFPCRYDCAAARAQAELVLDRLALEEPALAPRLRAFLSTPALYFEHGEIVRLLDGASDGDVLAYSGVSVPPSASRGLRSLAAAMAAGNRVELRERTLEVSRDNASLLRLERLDPVLGFLAPFQTPPT